MKRTIVLFLVIICFNVKAQPPSKWYNKFGGYGADIGYDVKQIYDKQYAIIGSTSSFGVSGTDGYLVLVDSMGQMLWQKTYGGAINDIAKSIVFNPLDSGFIFTGYTNSIGNGGYDIWIVRTDKNGNLKWQTSYGGLDWDFGNSVTLSSDNSIVVCGSLFNVDSVNKDGVILKYNLNGTLIWKKIFGGNKSDDLNSVIRTSDNNLFAVGYTKSFGDIDGDNYLIKLDLNGDTLFTRRTGGSSIDFSNDIIQKSDGTYIYVGGSSSYTNIPYIQSFMTCIDGAGNELWTNNFYASIDKDEAWVSVSENIIYSFHTYYLRNVPVPNFTMQGNLFFSQPGGWTDIVNSFGGFENEYFYNSASTTDGGVACVGETYSYGSIDKDIILIKLDSNIVSYQNLIGVKELNSINTNSFTYFNNSDLKQLNIFNSKQKETKAFIYNMLGQQVLTRTSKEEIITLDYSGLKPDVYLILLEEGTKQKAFKISVN